MKDCCDTLIMDGVTLTKDGDEYTDGNKGSNEHKIIYR